MLRACTSILLLDKLYNYEHSRTTATQTKNKTIYFVYFFPIFVNEHRDTPESMYAIDAAGHVLPVVDVCCLRIENLTGRDKYMYFDEIEYSTVSKHGKGDQRQALSC